MNFREITSDADIQAAVPLMSSLRDRIREETFLSEVRRQQIEGYRLYGAFEGDRLVSLAGVRRTHTLARGEHLFVDDLVTSAEDRGKGYGQALLAWLAEESARQGVARIHLDSRSTARGFYEKIGFAFATSLPCSIDADNPALRRRNEKTSAG
ncbi:MAG: GNAT family N-acetyltransferase [Acidobacteria bacterium]|nr:GNAT family N-acetyltransferase [Acidobacteriota bacterium]MCA1609313.1 GNAT family N-acetyltransferase [Acidobacteriota bacterium]